MYPSSLKTGDSVGIVATAGKLSYNRIVPALEKMERWGLKPVIMPSVKAQHGYFAGSDEVRLHDLQQMLDKPDIKAIFCARGGYGTTRIIDRIDWSGFLRSPKWLVGFSDITALHASIHRLGYYSLHAPTLNAWNDDESIRHIYCALFEKPKRLIAPPPSPNLARRFGRVQAPIIGGNLCMTAHLIGSSNALDTSGKILFLEEVGENMYAIDRFLTQLKRAGFFDNLAGLAVGDLDITAKQEKEFGMSVQEMVLDKISRQIPAAFDFPIGHKARNLAVIYGAEAVLTVNEQMASLEFEGFGV